MRRRKVTYPPPKTATKAAPPTLGFDPRNPPGRTVTINLAAIDGRASIKVGEKVRIQSGLYAGEAAVVESISQGVIPSAMVRTETGRTRRARTIDLEPIRPGAAVTSDAVEGTPGA